MRSSNQIILDTTLVDSGSRLYYYINYHFTITTPAGYDIVMHRLLPFMSANKCTGSY